MLSTEVQKGPSILLRLKLDEGFFAFSSRERSRSSETDLLWCYLQASVIPIEIIMKKWSDDNINSHVYFLIVEVLYCKLWCQLSILVWVERAAQLIYYSGNWFSGRIEETFFWFIIYLEDIGHSIHFFPIKLNSSFFFAILQTLRGENYEQPL